MAKLSRNAGFATFVTQHRGQLVAVSLLMFGSPARAEDVVQASLARLYRDWPGSAEALDAALRSVTSAQPQQLEMPWRRGERFELLDGGKVEFVQIGILADLAVLPAANRAAVILQCLRFSSAQTASVLGIDVGTVAAAAAAARDFLVSRDPARTTAGYLEQELGAAVWGPSSGSSDPAADIAHGRLLRRRRLLRQGAIAVTVSLVVVLGFTQLRPVSTTDQAISTPAPSAASPRRATCDTRELSCQTEVVQAWRTQMAAIANSYLDPRGGYFSGYTYSFDDLYDSQDFWRGRGGVLGFRLGGPSTGATEVTVQIATSAKFARPCGQQTNLRCLPVRFLEGNVYTLTDTTYVSQGIEAQYSPRGDEVITVVARNTSTRRELDITRAHLIALIQDPRLRLPPV